MSTPEKTREPKARGSVGRPLGAGRVKVVSFDKAGVATSVSGTAGAIKGFNRTKEFARGGRYDSVVRDEGFE